MRTHKITNRRLCCARVLPLRNSQPNKRRERKKRKPFVLYEMRSTRTKRTHAHTFTERHKTLHSFHAIQCFLLVYTRLHAKQCNAHILCCSHRNEFVVLAPAQIICAPGSRILFVLHTYIHRRRHHFHSSTSVVRSVCASMKP